MSPSYWLLEQIKNEEGQRVRNDEIEKALAEINGTRNHLWYYLSLTIDAATLILMRHDCMEEKIDQ